MGQAQLGLNASQAMSVRDLWAQTTLGEFSGSFSAELAWHEVRKLDNTISRIFTYIRILTVWLVVVLGGCVPVCVRASLDGVSE